TGFDTWNGDCIQLDLDLDPRKIVLASGNLLLDNDSSSKRRHTEIDLALTKNGSEAYRTRTFDPDKLPIALLQSDKIKLDVVKTGDGKLIYEAAIPWDTLGLTGKPKAGDAIGIAAAINDRDEVSPKQADVTAIGLFDGMAGANKNPEKFGYVVLGE
ncbi:MAG: sugar-binding protein, partial [Victivallales bacterium]